MVMIGNRNIQTVASQPIKKDGHSPVATKVPGAPNI